MSDAEPHVFLRRELEGVATFWRVHRRDGVTLGFTSHDRDLTFDGVRHRAAPGILPSAIRRTADLSDDSADMEGALSHDTITEADLAAGRFDGARVEIGAVDWESLERATLYGGEIGAVRRDAGSFQAQLRSAKARLDVDPLPRTSPTCRARFCDRDCALSPARFEIEAVCSHIDAEANSVTVPVGQPSLYVGGTLRWIDGPQAGVRFDIMALDDQAFVLDPAIDPGIQHGTKAILREGCDRTLTTCSTRFGNTVNFQGEPYLPGNDLLTRYPSAP